MAGLKTDRFAVQTVCIVAALLVDLGQSQTEPPPSKLQNLLFPKVFLFCLTRRWMDFVLRSVQKQALCFPDFSCSVSTSVVFSLKVSFLLLVFQPVLPSPAATPASRTPGYSTALSTLAAPHHSRHFSPATHETKKTITVRTRGDRRDKRVCQQTNKQAANARGSFKFAFLITSVFSVSHMLMFMWLVLFSVCAVSVVHQHQQLQPLPRLMAASSSLPVSSVPGQMGDLLVWVCKPQIYSPTTSPCSFTDLCLSPFLNDPVNFEALIITLGVVAGAVVLALIICCCYCCCLCRKCRARR